MRAPRTTPWGRITRVHPFPTDKTQHPGPGRSPSAASPALAPALAARHAGAGPTSCWPCRRRSPSASPAGRWPGCAGRRSSSTSRTSSPTSPSRSACSRTARVIAAASRLERLELPGRRRRHRAVRRPRATTSSPSSPASRRGRRRQGAGDPELRRHRAHPPGRPRQRATAGSSAWPARRSCCTPATSGSRQSLDLRRRGGPPARRPRPDVVFVVNGGGSALADLERRPPGLPNVRFGDIQPTERLPEVLATGDIHLVPLQAGPGQGERAVEALLDPRRRAARAGQRRRGHRGGPHGRAGRRRRRRAARGPRRLLRRPRPACSTTPRAPRRMGERGPPVRRGLGVARRPSRQRYEALFEELRARRGARLPATRGPAASVVRPCPAPVRALGRTHRSDGRWARRRRRRRSPGRPAPAVRAGPASAGRSASRSSSPASSSSASLLVALRPRQPRGQRRPAVPGQRGRRPLARRLRRLRLRPTSTSPTRPRPSSTPATDPLGIHTHGDGVIHIHPFTRRRRRPQRPDAIFFDDVGLEASRLEVDLPRRHRLGRGRDHAPSTVTRCRARSSSPSGTTPRTPPTASARTSSSPRTSATSGSGTTASTTRSPSSPRATSTRSRCAPTSSPT